MEILISILIGVALMEAYAWLDPLAKWLIDRAAQKLPEGSRDAFTEQWAADLEAMPNSIAKIVFAFRNCTLDVANIADEIGREGFEAAADKFDDFVDNNIVALDQVLQEQMIRLQENERPVNRLLSALNTSLEHLEYWEKNTNDDARKAISHFRAVSPSVIGPFSEFHSQLDQRQANFETLTVGLRQSVALAVETSQRVRRRLLDDTPIDDSVDQQLADLFTERVNNIGKAITDISEYFLTTKLVVPQNIAPNVKVVVDALTAAASAIKQGRS